MNLVVMIGNLARDPEIKYGANNLAIAKFTLALNRPPRNGEDAGADFVRVTAFGKQAELVERYLTKGRKVAIEGRIQTGSYDNKEGQKVYTTDVIANRIEFVGSRNDGGGNAGGDSAYSGNAGGSSYGGSAGSNDNAAPSNIAPSNTPQDVPSQFAEMDDNDDDLPF
jgi:single-strand DNA-binding protein